MASKQTLSLGSKSSWYKMVVNCDFTSGLSAQKKGICNQLTEKKNLVSESSLSMHNSMITQIATAQYDS